ncbi:MAG: hypothetical protein IK002_03805 [Treponema sp.]|uniref:hypothetical protein n=1 Tax=Treponema sp. TaxID=166 RepID=UPI00298DE0DF|nr:hypothetical protein [Treponema sp.]MBR5933094.1 hypothetical protein [Treponema sp.]
MKNRNRIITIIFLLFGFIAYCLMFNSCKTERKMQVSFKDIQDYYYHVSEKQNMMDFNPFYINEEFFDNVEKQLNEIIKDSDYYSILVQSSVNHGRYTISVLYNSKNQIFFHSWSSHGNQKYCQVDQSYAKNILKSRPGKALIITASNLIVSDGTSQYVIKMINRRKYYYANHYGEIDRNYIQLMDLFKIYSE